MTAEKRRELLRSYLWVEVVWNPVVTAVITFIQHPNGGFFSRFPISLFIGAVVSSLCFGGTSLSRVIEGWWTRRRGRPEVVHGTGWYLTLSALLMVPALFVAFQLTGRVFGIDFPFRWLDYQYGIFLGGIVTFVFFLWQTASDARDAARLAELRAREAEKSELVAQLAALTAQLNPHLLFNALNTVASLVRSDPDRAEETLLRLAELYRGVLAATTRNTHSLDAELKLCEAYLRVEQARFGDRLGVVVDVADDLRRDDVQVPVLVLQPLVENAVKHGLSPRTAPGTVAIRGHRDGAALELRVEDDGVGLDAPGAAGAGVGIENTRRRLRLCYAEGASLVLAAAPGGGAHAVLRLPMRTAA